jgi:ubiquinone/menaquinone biosynthesis C-methylase UbiE
MIDTSSNEIWKAAARPDSFETRAHRFREEMRPVFFEWLGITPESSILDAGCGSGVFTRYLAKGLHTGHITGFDINAGSIEYGRKKAEELGLDSKMTLETADGFSLHYADNTFDAVTNYTYIGVLSDPAAGMAELIRVCKPGGVVSCVIAANAIPNPFYQGGYPFEGADELQRLASLENIIFGSFARIASDFKQSEKWDAFRYPLLFESCGLAEIHMYPFGHLICYSDTDYPLEYRKQLAISETEDKINWLASRYAGKEDIYHQHGFSHSDFERMMQLLSVKLEYLKEHFDTDRSYEWHGGFNFIVTGRKAG